MEGSVAGVSVWQHRKSEPPESAWAALVKDPGQFQPVPRFLFTKSFTKKSSDH